MTNLEVSEVQFIEDASMAIDNGESHPIASSRLSNLRYDTEKMGEEHSLRMRREL